MLSNKEMQMTNRTSACHINQQVLVFKNSGQETDQLKNFPIIFCQPIKFADNVTQCYYLSVTALIEEIITATIT